MKIETKMGVNSGKLYDFTEVAELKITILGKDCGSDRMEALRVIFQMVEKILPTAEDCATKTDD